MILLQRKKEGDRDHATKREKIGTGNSRDTQTDSHREGGKQTHIITKIMTIHYLHLQFAILTVMNATEKRKDNMHRM